MGKANCTNAVSACLLAGFGVFSSICAASLQVRLPATQVISPEYTNGDELVRPDGYREWVFLSSGLRMGDSMTGNGAVFTNVFVTAPAYQQFMASGSWPDKSVFVEEKRNAARNDSNGKAVQSQAELLGISVQVKDLSRFPDQWAFFSFDSSQKTAKPNLKASCWQCHHERGAVEATFVQFYPTLKPVAETYGTYHAARESSDSSSRK